MTFMGLGINENGDCINMKDKSIVKTGMIDKQLRQLLQVNGVRFMEDYDTWQK